MFSIPFYILTLESIKSKTARKMKNAGKYQQNIYK